MEQKILTLVKEKPKHYSRLVKNSIELNQWVLSNTLVESKSYAEMIYSAVYQHNGICPTGNKKKFKDFGTGYVFCNSANKCQCAKKSVSIKVSKSKQNYSQEKKASINSKRVKTTLKKYGVTNNGQTQNALKKHEEFYNNKDKVRDAINKNHRTKFEKYGNKNYNNSSKIKETYAKNHPLEYWETRFPDKKMAILMDKNLLKDHYKKYPVIEDLATYLNVHPQTVYRHLYIHGLREKYKSVEEQEIVNFIKSLEITNVVQNSRKIITVEKYVNGEYVNRPREIDIYLPDYNLAIEYCGVYWHHEDVEHITKDYHYQKYKACDDKKIQLLTIFSTHWHRKKELLKQTIKNKLGLVSNSIYARKCTIDANISIKEHREFLDKNHIQGYTTSQYQVGLRYNEDLVALMTFSLSRTGIGKNEDTTELVRYSSSNRIQGGASKLLTHFMKNYKKTKIISYSNNEWSNGNLYKALGCVLETDIKPSYWYIKRNDDKMYHRYNFAKHKLVEKGYDSNKTERQITREMGLLKLWDCGKKRWVLGSS